MARDYTGKKVVKLQIEHLKGHKLKQFIAYCFQISDKVSLSTINAQYMMKHEVKEAVKKYQNSMIKEEGLSLRRAKSRTSSYYEMIKCQEVAFIKSQETLEKFNDSYLLPYQLIKREITCKTHCTWGNPMLVCYFSMNDDLEKCFIGMEDLFGMVELGEENAVKLEDPAFYKGEELICSICSHESRGYLVLREDEYELFRVLRIGHDVHNTDKVWTLEEWLQECAYQEREELVIHGYARETIPEEIGAIITLKKLEIFDYQVRHLPKSLENLTELECLRITGNQVEELGFDLSKLTNLKELDLSGVPLKSFPEGIIQLTHLEVLYMSGIRVNKVPESLKELTKLRVLVLPELEESTISKELGEFIKKLKPKRTGTSLVDILGEEKIRSLMEQGHCITMGGGL